MFRRILYYLTLTALVAGITLAGGNNLAQSQADPTPTPGGLRLVPDTPRPTPIIPSLTPPEDAEPREFTPPPTLDELVEQFPELEAYIEEFLETALEDLDLNALYIRVLEIYAAEGASGLAVFLGQSGILEKLGLPLSYLDLLIEFDEGGLEAVEELARTRQIINDADELVGYMTIDERDNLDVASAALEELGVSVYQFLLNTNELQFGIPLAILAQFTTPEGLIEYLVQIANVPGAAGIRPPVPVQTTGRLTVQDVLNSEGGVRVGAGPWFAEGFTGAGVRIGVLDLGFGNIGRMIRDGHLPANMTANVSGDVLNSQTEDHGTACALVVHRAAPGAELFIAYTDGSFGSFVSALEWLAEQDVDIVTHSVGSDVGPRDGVWGMAGLVNEFVRQTGALWVNSAGNQAMSHTLWEFNGDADGIHQFGDGNLLAFQAYTEATTAILNWDGNWDGGERANYTLVILDTDLNEVAVAAEPKSGRAGDFPFQITRFPTIPGEIYLMAVVSQSGSNTNHILDISLYAADFDPWAQVPQYSISSPGDASSSLTVGATGLRTDDIEDYSSQGPTGDNRIKPDLTAPTGEFIPGYERQGFTGTSGSTPLVAAIAALVKERFPDLTNAEIAAFLMENVIDLGEPGMDIIFGSGRLAIDQTIDRPTDDGGDEGGKRGGAFVLTPIDTGARITSFDVWFDSRVRGETGVEVALSFEVDNMLDKEIATVMVFYDANGNPLTPQDEDYLIFGTVGTGQIFTVLYEQSVFSNVTMFLPYTAFPQLSAGTSLSYIVAILDLSGEEIVPLWESEIGTVTIN